MIKNMRMTKTTATIGSTIEMNDSTIAVPVSIKETTGLPNPPVVTVDVNRVALELPDITAAVPPPAALMPLPPSPTSTDGDYDPPADSPSL